MSLFSNKEKVNIKKTTWKSTAGFTLLELLVTITIFVVLTTAILISNSKFKSDLLITNLAYEIALSIREAQTYGINVKGQGTDFKYAYGINFDADNNNTKFILFVDESADGVFKSDKDRVEKEFNIRGGNYISGLSVFNSSSGEVPSRKQVDVVFKRPDPEAKIREGGKTDPHPTYIKARIYISSPDGVIRKIEVSDMGQISVLSF